MHDLTNGSEVLTPVGEEIQRPAHYTQGNIECIDYITDKEMSYVEGNIIKYITRYRHKGGLQDLYKAQWYITRLINDYTIKLGLEEPKPEDEPEWVPPAAEEITKYLQSLNVLHRPVWVTAAPLCEHEAEEKEEEDFSGVWHRESPGATGEGTRLDTYTRDSKSDDDWSLENCRKPVPIYGDNPVCEDPCGEFPDRGCIKCVNDPVRQMTPYMSPSEAMAYPSGHPYTKDNPTNPCGKGECIHGTR